MQGDSAMRLKIQILITALLGFASQLQIARANDGESTPRKDPSVFFIYPGSEVVLMPDEQIELKIVAKGDKPVGTEKLVWSINGEPMGQNQSALGTLTPAGGDDSASSSIIYTAPSRVRDNKPIVVSASLASSSKWKVGKCQITLTENSNWIAIDGDSRHAPRSIAIQLDPTLKPAAGFGAIPFGQLKNSFVIHLPGTVKGDPSKSVVLDVNCGPNSQPSTFQWRTGKPFIGVNMVFGVDNASSLDFSRGVKSLDGSTTITAQDVSDAPGLVKGFFSGKLRWPELSGASVQTFYFTVRGHFAFRGIAAPGKP